MSGNLKHLCVTYTEETKRKHFLKLNTEQRFVSNQINFLAEIFFNQINSNCYHFKMQHVRKIYYKERLKYDYEGMQHQGKRFPTCIIQSKFY